MHAQTYCSMISKMWRIELFHFMVSVSKHHLIKMSELVTPSYKRLARILKNFSIYFPTADARTQAPPLAPPISTVDWTVSPRTPIDCRIDTAPGIKNEMY